MAFRPPQTNPLPHDWHAGDLLTDEVQLAMIIDHALVGPWACVAIGPNAAEQEAWRAVKACTLPEDGGASRGAFIGAALDWLAIWPHPNIARVDGIVMLGATPAVLLAFADGGDLRLWLLGQGRAAIRQGMTFAQQLAAALATLHGPDATTGRGALVHGDLKPQNILLQRGALQVSDVGMAARMAPPGSGWFPANGAPYRAPELWSEGADPSPASDCYALGMVLNELFTGYHPLGQSRGINDWQEAHAIQTPQGPCTFVPGLPASLDELVRALLAKEPILRPTAAQCSANLRAIAEEIGQEPYVAPPVSGHDPVHWWEILAGAQAAFGDATTALASYERALSQAPDRAPLWAQAARTLQQLGRFNDAAAAFREAGMLAPEQSAYRLGEAGARRAAAQYELALTDYGVILDREPYSVAAWLGRGLTLRAMHRHTEALAAFDKALTLDERNAAIWQAKGITLSLLQRHAEALAAYEASLALDPSLALAWNGKGNALSLLERHEDAARAFEEASRLAAGDATIWRNLANEYNHLAHFQDALDAIQEAIIRDPDNARNQRIHDNARRGLGQLSDDLFDTAHHS